MAELRIRKSPPTRMVGGLGIGGPGGARTLDQRIMLTTTAFAAPFGFVVWTIPSHYRLAV